MICLHWSTQDKLFVWEWAGEGIRNIAYKNNLANLVFKVVVFLQRKLKKYKF